MTTPPDARISADRPRFLNALFPPTPNIGLSTTNSAAMPEMGEATTGPRVLYQCVSCGKIFERERVTRFAETQCPYCGYNVIKKARSQSAKLLKTSELGRDSSLAYFGT